MESRWYLFPGQTPENTKISDRANALHITKTEWGRITQHLDRKKRIQEALDKERAHKEALKIGSQSMTKEWADSIENLQKRKEKERADRLNQDTVQLQMEMYYKLREEQEVLRQQYVDKVRKNVFRSQGYPKQLSSAFLQSETLYEREKQVEFQNMLRNHDRDVENKWAEDVIEGDRRGREADTKEKQDRLDKNRANAQVIKKQIDDKETTLKEETRTRIERQTLDRINAAKEEELIKQFVDEAKMRKQKAAKQERLEDIEEAAKKRQIAKLEEQELHKATQFYEEAKQRIHCMMKVKDKEWRDDLNAKHEAMAQMVAAVVESKEPAEQARLARAVAERAAAEEEKEEARLERLAKARQERIEDRREHLERAAKEKHFDDEMKRWGLLNRVKAGEVLQEHERELRRKKLEKIQEYRRDILNQIAEDKETARNEKDIEEIMSRVSYEEADRMFFDYANEVMELAVKNNRPTYPIEKVIMEYKRVNHLVSNKRERRCRHMK